MRQDRRLSPATVSVRIAAISHFYEMNDVVINWRKLKKFKGRHRNIIEDRPYTRDEIKKLVDVAPLRDKAIILLMASSGMRKGAIPYLRMRDITKIDKYQLYKINVYKKEQESYITYCTPECVRFIDQYIKWRERLGEKMTPNTPLFRTEFDPILQLNRAQAIGVEGIAGAIRRLINDTAVRISTGGRTEIMQTHGFRKFFKTTCINAGMNPLYSEYVMGHRSGLTKSYFKPTDQELLEGNEKALGYVAAINDLTINEEHRLTEKVNELQLKNDQIMELERRHKKDLETVQNQMAQMMAMIRQEPRLAKIKAEALLNKKVKIK
jgi:integrase